MIDKEVIVIGLVVPVLPQQVQICLKVHLDVGVADVLLFKLRALRILPEVQVLTIKEGILDASVRELHY